MHLCVEYRKRQLEGHTWEVARERVAEAEGVSESAVKNAVSRYGKRITKNVVRNVPLLANK